MNIPSWHPAYSPPAPGCEVYPQLVTADGGPVHVEPIPYVHSDDRYFPPEAVAKLYGSGGTWVRVVW